MRSRIRVQVHRAVTAIRTADELDLTPLWIKGIKAVLSLLILTTLAALTGGVIKTFLDLRLLLNHPMEVALRQVIVDTLILLAIVEVFKTTMTYLTEGRVKVTFIVDTILVVMLTEVISQWFKGGELSHLAVLGGIFVTLGIMRILAVRYSPAQGNHGREAAWEDTATKIYSHVTGA